MDSESKQIPPLRCGMTTRRASNGNGNGKGNGKGKGKGKGKGGGRGFEGLFLVAREGLLVCPISLTAGSEVRLHSSPRI